ncbi:hypothetical protein DV735_g1082, partial [Chaetothyriales sp. CBS 134920]
MVLPSSGASNSSYRVLLIVTALALTALARPTPQPQSNSDSGSDDGSSGYSDDGSGGDDDSGSSGPSSSWQLSTGAAVAIGVVVGVIVIGAIIMTTLFYLSKKRQWRLRERARGSMRRVGSGLHKAIMTPRTPMQMTFSPSMKANKSRGASSSGGAGAGEIKTQRFTQGKGARIPDSSPQRQEERGRTERPRTTGPSSSLDPARRKSQSRTRSIGQGLSINTNLASAAPPAIGTLAGRTEIAKNNSTRKKVPQALNTGVERVQSESKFDMDSPRTPFLNFSWDDEEPTAAAPNIYRPPPTFPKLDLPVPRPLDSWETASAKAYLSFRIRCHNSPFYSTLDPSTQTDDRGKVDRRAGVDPFNDQEVYSKRFERRKRTEPDLGGGGGRYALQFFPKELWPFLDPKHRHPLWATIDDGDRLKMVGVAKKRKRAKALVVVDEDDDGGQDKDDEDEDEDEAWAGCGG